MIKNDGDADAFMFMSVLTLPEEVPPCHSCEQCMPPSPRGKSRRGGNTTIPACHHHMDRVS
jgi:hypothetical protein